MAQLKQFLKFVKEREAIRIRRLEGLPSPWTKDKILQIYRFCNVRRIDDRVSQWLVKHILTEKNIAVDLPSFLMFSAWARLINWPPTVQKAVEAGFYPVEQIDWAKLGAFVDKLPGKRWTGAFMLPAPKRKGAKKGRFLAQQVVGKCFSGTFVLPELLMIFNRPSAMRSCKEVWEVLQRCNYFGSFLAGQVVADWSYTSLLSQAYDLTTWAAPGPGSIRGYNYLLGITPLRKRPPEDKWLINLQLWRQKIIEILGPAYSNMDLQSCQNCLCEWSKYCRTKRGTGRPRANYHPHTYEV